jgi:flavodoxin
MSKTLVAYFSRTGNTKKVAEAIFAALDGDKTVQPIDTVDSRDVFRFVFIGFPVQSHSVPFAAEKFLKSLPPGTPIALFCTHGALSGHPLSKEALEYAAVLSVRCRLYGVFACRGKLSPQALEALLRSPEHQDWAEMAGSAATHPDEHDLAEAAAFARHMKAKSSSPAL